MTTENLEGETLSGGGFAGAYLAKEFVSGESGHGLLRGFTSSLKFENTKQLQGDARGYRRLKN